MLRPGHNFKTQAASPIQEETWSRFASCRGEQTDSLVVVGAAGGGQKWNISPEAGRQIQTRRSEIQKAKTGQRSKQRKNEKTQRIKRQQAES